MHQPINSSCGSHRIFKNLLPFGKRQIAGNHQAAAFVLMMEELIYFSMMLKAIK
jgi:hypothetical protein